MPTHLVLAQQLLLQELLLLLLLLADGGRLRSLLSARVAQALQLLVVPLRQRSHIKRREAAQDARIDSLDTEHNTSLAEDAVTL